MNEELKDKIKNNISEYIQANIKKHYQYIGEEGIHMNVFNRRFIPTLLKEINKDIQEMIEKIFEEENKNE